MSGGVGRNVVHLLPSRRRLDSAALWREMAGAAGKAPGFGCTVLAPADARILSGASARGASLQPPRAGPWRATENMRRVFPVRWAWQASKAQQIPMWNGRFPPRAKGRFHAYTPVKSGVSRRRRPVDVDAPAARRSPRIGQTVNGSLNVRGEYQLQGLFRCRLCRFSVKGSLNVRRACQGAP